MGCVSTRAMLVPAGTVMVLASAAGFAEDDTASCARPEIAMSKVEVKATLRRIFVLARDRNALVERMRRLQSFADIRCLLLKVQAFRSSGDWRVLLRSLALRPQSYMEVR